MLLNEYRRVLPPSGPFKRPTLNRESPPRIREQHLPDAGPLNHLHDSHFHLGRFRTCRSLPKRNIPLGSEMPGPISCVTLTISPAKRSGRPCIVFAFAVAFACRRLRKVAFEGPATAKPAAAPEDTYLSTTYETGNSRGSPAWNAKFRVRVHE